MQGKIPPEIRKACMLLGVRADDLTLASVLKAWKQQISAPGVHLEQGGDRESAIYINSAKDTLVRWLEGYPGGGGPNNDTDPPSPSRVPKNPKPGDNNNVVRFPSQE